MINHALIFSSRTNFWERSSGAHRVATYLRNNGMDVEVIDFTPFWNLDMLKEFTKKSVTSKTLFFGFSIFFNAWNLNMPKFSSWLKKEYPHIKTIAGGQNITQADLTNIDIWIDSYGEEAILAVAKSLAGNSVNGLIFSPEFFGTKKVIKALHSYPSYNLGDYSIIMEKRDFLEPWEWPTIEFSRGCKFSCAFCNFPILGVKEDTSRTAESFEQELKYNYDNFGITRYFVADETFNDRVEKITKFADVVEKLNFEYFFSGFIRADLLIKPSMIEELARLNFGGQYYGIETFNRDSGKIIGKGMDPEKVKSLLLDTKSYFKKHNSPYRGTISLIVGLPFDTKEQWTENEKWLDQNWSDQSLINFALMVEDLENLGKHEYTNVSKFAMNLQKYGLRKIGTRSVDRFNRKYGTYNFYEVGHSVSEQVWEHDTMNLFEAKEISKYMKNKATQRYKLNSWALSWPEIKLKKKTSDLQKSFDTSIWENAPIYNEFSKFIYNYSLKKLNK